MKYYNKIQGFVYNLLKDTPFSSLHDKIGYKYFCFSNIFPVRDIKLNDERNLIISSPSEAFINIMEEKVKTLSEQNKPINIGEYQFKIEKISKLKIRLKNNTKLISATPIVIRIPEANYDKYNIPKEFRKKRYVYWRPEYSFEAFVKQLEENLIKKYNEYHKKNQKIDKIFEIFKFIKPTVNHVIINGRERMIAGSLWEFSFTYLTKEQKEILKFGIDCGFGERNSLGFGFMNAVDKGGIRDGGHTGFF
jgi:CRISPR-associated endoribonuclease Cas6